MTVRQEERAKGERETEDRGNSEGVARVEVATLRRTRVAHIGEGSTTGIDIEGGTACID